jgi:hypothetical protein
MSLCKAKCGFFGQDHLNGYCSVCAPRLTHDTSDAVQTDSMSLKMDTVLPTPSGEKTRSRCTQCSKKVGLLGFECACKGVYCPKCRHAESHQCTYDFSSVGKALLQKNNPVVTGVKMVRMD